ncbi:Ig-like domain-containing protein [Nonlabens tegetincola]|uniref:Ig-like domain-containing protein n=1 Tax=Nonlabens tegetincola TaxID=323273 RepID=UPI0037438FD7
MGRFTSDISRWYGSRANPDGTLNVIPATDSTEPISFEYTVADEDGLTDTGMVDITFTQFHQ